MGEPAYCFGEFRLEPSERRLVGPDGAIALPPKTFDLLVILAANAGRLLKKDDLMNRLWPGVFVEEVNLAQNVSALRRALGGEKKTFVETVPGAGYRFVAGVAVVDPESAGSERAETRPPRLIVLPFRLLTPDAALAFLPFSLADAVTASLSGLDTVVVRSSLTAARYASDAVDLGRIAREADVSLVLSGTIVHSAQQLRVTVQLADAVAGALLWSHTEIRPMEDLFPLQDALVERIVGSLELPLTSRERRRLRHDVPSSARVYEYYLRGNQASVDSNSWPVARDLYLQALDEDPNYAPAWARLARIYRLIGKYRPETHGVSLARAEQALQRALTLNPELPVAHTLYAQIEADRGCAQDAMVRLLQRARVHPADPEVYAGLVYTCRYSGLVEASLAADERARRLDSTLVTSVMHSLFIMRRYEEVLAAHGTIKGYVYVVSLFCLGRREEAIAMAAALIKEGNRVQDLVVAALALFEGRRDDSVAMLDRLAATMNDPEGLYYFARQHAYLQNPRGALDALTRAMDGGYFGYSGMSDDPWLETLRGNPAFGRLLDRAREGQASARHAFAAAGGDTIVGTASDAT